MELTATATFLEALQAWNGLDSRADGRPSKQRIDGLNGEAVIRDAPVPYAAYIDLSRQLKQAGVKDFALDSMLRGARVYVAPPPPKSEPTPEYKALMARLRRDEEEQSYQRMLQPAAPRDVPIAAHTYASVNRAHKDDEGDDDISFGDVNRQLMLLLNFAVSIIGVAATLWVLARWWSTPARLLLTMAGSIVVAIAEVGVYSGYIWHLGEAKKKEEKTKEERKIVQTWVLGKDEDTAEGIMVGDAQANDQLGVRKRKKQSNTNSA